jgi:hypothetical protein
VPDSDEQVLQNFLTHSAWDYRGVMDQVAMNADHCVGSEVGAGLYVDESSPARSAPIAQSPLPDG